MQSLILISGAGLLAGAMNALAGGGSFVSLPALIAVGVPPVQANASSTVALFPSGVASAWVYRDAISPLGQVSIRSLAVTTLLGGFAGAALLLHTSSQAFSFALPWLLLLASIALTFGRRVGEALRGRWRIHAFAVLAIQFFLGIYGGYFGGAVGIMMVAVWGLIDGRDIKRLNALRTLLVTVANASAVSLFVAANAVHWSDTLIMLVAATVGGYLGAHAGRRAPSYAIRAGTLLLTYCVTLVFFVRTYAPSLWH